MDKKLAVNLLPFVNSNAYDICVENYINARLTKLKDDLAMESSEVNMRRSQGSIAELKRFITLRDEVNIKVKDEKSL